MKAYQQALLITGGIAIIAIPVGFRHYPEKIIPAVIEYHSAITHEVYHEAVSKITSRSCIQANIGSYAGNCATARCGDGTYTGANPSYYLTCNYHGWVAEVGPFYVGGDVVVEPAWTETVVDTPARTEVITPEKKEEAYTTWYGIRI